MTNSEPNLHLWELLSWVTVSACLAMGGWWLLYVPTVGKGGLFVAMAAVLMPLFWDKIGVAGRMFWIGILSVLLAVEYRAIDKDQREKAEAQKKELEAIGNGFSSVLGGQERRFSDLIDQNTSQFTTAMAKAQQNVDELTGGNSYLYFDISDPMGPIEIDPYKGLMIINAIPVFRGTFPLHNVYVATFCTTTRWLPNIDYGTMFPHENGRPRQILELSFRPEGERQRCNVMINTSNGSYSQEVLFLKQERNGRGRRGSLRARARSRFEFRPGRIFREIGTPVTGTDCMRSEKVSLLI